MHFSTVSGVVGPGHSAPGELLRGESIHLIPLGSRPNGNAQRTDAGTTSISSRCGASACRISVLPPIVDSAVL